MLVFIITVKEILVKTIIIAQMSANSLNNNPAHFPANVFTHNVRLLPDATTQTELPCSMLPRQALKVSTAAAADVLFYSGTNIYDGKPLFKILVFFSWRHIHHIQLTVHLNSRCAQTKAGTAENYIHMCSSSSCWCAYVSHWARIWRKIHSTHNPL